MADIISLIQANREIVLTKELADTLDYYTGSLNFKNNISRHNKRLAITEHCINLRIDKELADSKIDKFIIPKHRSQDIFDPLQSFEEGKIKVRQKPGISTKEIEARILKMIKDIQAYRDWPNTRKSVTDHQPARPVTEFEGINIEPPAEPKLWGLNLSEQNHQNLYRYCLKNDLNMDEVILKWLSEYLSKELKEADFKRIQVINKAVNDAWGVIGKEKSRKNQPAWDLS